MTDYEPLLKQLIAAVKNISTGVLRVNTSDSARASAHYVGFDGAFTIVGPMVVWTPAVGCRYIVKGIYVTGVVTVALNAANDLTFFFADSVTGAVVAPIAAAAMHAVEGTVFPTIAIDLREGCVGSGAGAALQIIPSRSIDTGAVHFTGIVFGEEQVV